MTAPLPFPQTVEEARAVLEQLGLAGPIDPARDHQPASAESRAAFAEAARAARAEIRDAFLVEYGGPAASAFGPVLVSIAAKERTLDSGVWLSDQDVERMTRLIEAAMARARAELATMDQE